MASAELAVTVRPTTAEDVPRLLELFGALLSTFAEVKTAPESHRVKVDDGNTFEGTWEEIVDKMRHANCLKDTPKPEQDAESFIRRSADAGLLRILR